MQMNFIQAFKNWLQLRYPDTALINVTGGSRIKLSRAFQEG